MSNKYYDDLIDALKNGDVRVHFMKVDGSARIMDCTLKEGEFPEYTSTRTKTPNDDVIAVWDIENAGWRSFRKDSVTAYYKLPIESIDCDVSVQGVTL